MKPEWHDIVSMEFAMKKSIKVKKSLAIALVLLWITGCFGSTHDSGRRGHNPPSFTARLSQGDHQMSWALTYFRSWRRDHQPRYLFLAEKHIKNAVSQFAHLQADTSPRINEFYVIRDRRVRSCQILAEVQFSAASYGLSVKQAPAQGCMF